MEYPKIETLFNRDPENMKRVLLGEFRAPEFELINRWHITEKIDGTNIRVTYDGSIGAGENRVRYEGRTDAAQIPAFLLDTLQSKFTPALFERAFDLCGPDASQFKVTLYGEGYGARIQKGGGNYRRDTNFRLFDVRIGDWWLNWENVEDIAAKLYIETVPVLARDSSLAPAISLVKKKSFVAAVEGGADVLHEGIVARTDPLLFDRRGHRIMWKLKVRDLE